MKCSEGIAPPFSHADYCPGVYNCTELTGEEGYSPLVNDIWPSVVSIVSSSLSVLSSLLIIYTYVRWKDLRTGSRSIITFLAIADLVTASGYVMGAANYISHFGKREGSEACKVFQTLCEIQSFLTSTSSLSSFVWTSVLAVYLYLVIVKSKFILAKKLLPLYHIAAWLLPLFITLPLLVAGKLGYSSFAASNWCFIADKMPHTNLKEQCGHFDWEIFLFVLVGGKAWEILTYILVVVLYIAIKWDIYKKVREVDSSGSPNVSDTISVIQAGDRKLTFIPVVFILLRIWGTAQFFYIMALSHTTYYGCVPRGYWYGNAAFGYVQAIGDGGQGWGNVILYVLASAKIRQRLWQCVVPSRPTWRCLLLLEQPVEPTERDYLVVSEENSAVNT